MLIHFLSLFDIRLIFVSFFLDCKKKTIKTIGSKILEPTCFFFLSLLGQLLPRISFIFSLSLFPTLFSEIFFLVHRNNFFWWLSETAWTSISQSRHLWFFIHYGTFFRISIFFFAVLPSDSPSSLTPFLEGSFYQLTYFYDSFLPTRPLFFVFFPTKLAPFFVGSHHPINRLLW